MPAGITDPRERAAYQAVLDYYAGIDAALDAWDTVPLERVTTPSCFCRVSRLQQVATMRAHGERMRGGGYEGLRVDGYMTAGQDRAAVTSQEGILPGEDIDACGRVVDHQDHFVGEFIGYVLVWRGGRWLVDSDDLIREAHDAVTGEFPVDPGTAPTGIPSPCSR